MSGTCPMCGSPIPPPQGEAQIEAIIRAVCRRFCVDRNDLIGNRRHKTIAEARQIGMYIARRLTPMSLPEIGRAFRRDHTTVMQACRKLGSTDNPQLLAAIDSVLTLVGGTDPLRKAG